MSAKPHSIVAATTFALLFGLLGALPRSAAASAGEDTVRHARLALAEYDLEGSETTDVIRSLGQAIPELRGRKKREARFLRAMATADLVLIARIEGDDALAARAARAFGVAPGKVVPKLVAALRPLAVGVYADAAKDSIATLRAVTALEAGQEVAWDKLSGPRSDALLVGRVRRLVEQDGDAVTALAPLADADPCAKKGQPCPEPFYHFDALGRRAVSALLEGRAAIARLQKADAAGDPFPHALRKRLAADVKVLSAAKLAPSPQLPDGLPVTEVKGGPQAPDVEVLLVVLDGEVRYGWVPRVTLDDDGEAKLLVGGHPVLPETESVRIPHDFRPAVQPIDSLTTALRKVAGPGPGPLVAIASAPGVYAHVVSRVLHSAKDAGMAPVGLAGRDAKGGLRGVRVNLRDAREGTDGRPAAEVRVRMGGYTVKTSHGSSDVSRVRDDSGLHFDVAGLKRATGDHLPTASLDFMTVAEMGPVTEAALALAPTQAPLQLLIP